MNSCAGATHTYKVFCVAQSVSNSSAHLPSVEITIMSWCCGRRGRVIGAVLGAVAVGALVALLVLKPWAGDHPRYPNAVVAANGYECAKIGRDILEANGSTVDAAIATLFCEGLTCAQCMGLGGGFLATLYDAKSGKVEVLNARERAPMAAHQDMFQNTSSTVGGLAVAVPGELRGYGAMYAKYGRLPWEKLVEPATKLCREGFIVSNYMARVLKTYSDVIIHEPSMREIYVNPETGEVWKEGDHIKDWKMAQTLEVIAREGPEAIHNGSLTAALARDIQGVGGIVTEDDLKNFRVEWQEPIKVSIGSKRTLYSVPLPGTGSVLSFILNMWNGWIGDKTEAPTGSNLYWHRIIETFKFAYAQRTGLGDPNHSVDLPFNIAELEKNLSNVEWARSFRNKVDDARTISDWHHYGAFFEGVEDHGTAHIIVVGPDGSVASVTSTVNYIWGAQRRARTLGFILNNEMDDFAIPQRANAYGMPPSPANMIAPNLQPLSSMVPSIILDDNGKLVMVIGGAGGTKITTQVALTVQHTLFENEYYPTVARKPRLHHQLLPMEIEYEEDFSMSIIEGLEARGHATTKRGKTTGFAALIGAVREPDGYLLAQTDRRRPGSIDGF